MLIGLALKHGDGFLTVIYYIPTKHLTIFHNVFFEINVTIHSHVYFFLSLSISNASDSHL